MTIRDDIQRLKTYFWGKDEYPVVHEQFFNHWMGTIQSGMVRSNIVTNHSVLTFEDGQTDYIDFQTILPRLWKGSRVYFDIFACAPTTTTGNVYWQVQYMPWFAGTTISSAASGSAYALKAAPGVAYRPFVGQNNFMLLGTAYYQGAIFRLIRWAADGLDTANTNIHFLGMRIKVTSP